MVKVFVCGSRYLKGQDALAVWDGLDAIDDQIGEITTIVSGNTAGADSMARRYAENHKIDFLELGYDNVLDDAKPDVILAVGDVTDGIYKMMGKAWCGGIKVIHIPLFEEENDHG